MKRKLAWGTFSLLACLALVWAFTSPTPATEFCEDDPTSPCCSFFPNSTPQSIGDETVCAGFGFGCWECVDLNAGTSCVDHNVCDPPDLRKFVPIVP